MRGRDEIGGTVAFILVGLLAGCGAPPPPQLPAPAPGTLTLAAEPTDEGLLLGVPTPGIVYVFERTPSGRLDVRVAAEGPERLEAGDHLMELAPATVAIRRIAVPGAGTPGSTVCTETTRDANGAPVVAWTGACGLRSNLASGAPAATVPATVTTHRIPTGRRGRAFDQERNYLVVVLTRDPIPTEALRRAARTVDGRWSPSIVERAVAAALASHADVLATGTTLAEAARDSRVPAP